VAALLASTAIIPTPAQAMPPVVAFVVSVVGAITAAFTAVGVAVGLTGAALAAFASFATQLVIGLALAALARLLMPKPAIPEPSARMVNYAQAITYMDTIYGTVRKGGPIAYTNFGDKKRDVVVILAGHEIDGIEQHWLDEWPVSVSGTTVTTTPPGSLASIYVRLGTDPQATLPVVSKYAELTSAHDFAGLAVAQISAGKPASDKFSTNYPRGREWAYAPVIRGRNDIFDPRDDSFKFTDNAALILADWATRIMGRSVNWDDVATEANVADTLVPKKGGGTQRKWTINGSFAESVDDDQLRAQFGTACDAYIYETPEGEVGFKLGRYIEPTITLTEDDFYSMTVSEGTSEQEAPNEILINYTEPQNAWRETPSAPWIADPEGRRIREDYSIFFINSHNQAIRIAKRLSRAKRSQYKINGIVKYRAHRIMKERFIRVSHAELGIDAVFEVDVMIRNEDGMSYELGLVSVVAEDFDFDPDVEEPSQPAYGDVIPVVDDDRPTGVTAVSISIGGTPGLRTSWTAANSVNAARVRWAEKDTGNWIESGVIPAGTLFFDIFPLDDQTTYDIQVAAVTGFSGAQLSTFEPVVPVEATPVLNSTPPNPLTTFATSVLGSDVTIEFQSPNDPNYFATRIYRGTTTDFGSATAIQTEYGAANSADSFVDAGRPVGTYYYWGEPINSSGVAGAVSGPEIAEVV